MHDPQRSDDPSLMTAARLVALYKRGELSPVDATRAALQRIERHDPEFNAYCWTASEQALEQAKRSEARWRRGEPVGLLDGVPLSVKDVLLTKGWPTLYGSRTVNKNRPWETDAPAVSRVREHGAILLGKTTTSEFHWKTVTDSPLTGITRNPWNPVLTPGGSCGGAAVAVATGMGALAIGTDGGGSIRVPSSFCGVFGLKPTFGRVPRYPIASANMLAHVGAIARSVADAALLLNVIAEPDLRDWYALPYEKRDYRVGIEDGVRGLRIAFSAKLGYVRVDAEVAGLVARAVERLSELGAHVEEDSPGFADPKAAFEALWYPDLAATVDRIPAEQRSLMDPGLLNAANEGAQYTLRDQLLALRERELVGERMQLFHADYDVLLTPTLPMVAFEVGRDVPDPAQYERWVDWAPFSYPFNLTRQPAASIPCGLTQPGLPVGLQVVGPLYREDLVLRVCGALESISPIILPV